MKYYLIYLQSGTVVHICSFDDEKSRDDQHTKFYDRIAAQCLLSIDFKEVKHPWKD